MNVHKQVRQLKDAISTVPPLSQIYPLQLISCTPDYTSNNYNSTQNIEYLCQARYCNKVAPYEKLT